MNNTFNLSKEYGVFLWDPLNVPSDKLYAGLKTHPILSRFENLDRLIGIDPLDFPGWLADLQHYSEENGLTLYAQ